METENTLFDLAEWFHTLKTPKDMNSLLISVFSVDYCISIEGGKLKFKYMHDNLSVYGEGMYVVVLPMYQAILSFNRAELQQDWMRFFHNVFSETFTETVYRIKLDTGVFMENTYADGASICFLKDTDLLSVLGDFPCRIQSDEQSIALLLRSKPGE